MAELIPLPRRASFGKTGYNGLESSVLEALPQAVITTDLDGRIKFWNKAAELLYGWRSEEVLGRNVLEVTPTADSASAAAAILTTLKLGERWEGVFQVRHKDGHWFEAKVIDSPVYDANGTLIRHYGGFSTRNDQSPNASYSDDCL